LAAGLRDWRRWNSSQLPLSQYLQLSRILIKKQISFKKFQGRMDGRQPIKSTDALGSNPLGSSIDNGFYRQNISSLCRRMWVMHPFRL
jgi:hypothetical protein